MTWWLRITRWLPLACGRKPAMTLAEQRKALGTSTERNPPKRTQAANRSKLRAKESRLLSVVKREKRA